MAQGAGPRTPGLRAATVIAAAEGVAFAANALLVAVVALREGPSGPQEVSNVPAILMEIGIFAVFGAGLLVVARGLWRARRWARAPFLLAQLFGVLVGYDMAQGEGAERVAGVLAIAAGVIGLVLCFTPSVTAELEDRPPGGAR